MTATTADLSAMLSPKTLLALRDAYAPDFMLKASRGAVAAPHPPGAGLVDWLITNLYDPARIEPAHRERVLVALLASQSVGPSFTLAVHLYWALMEGVGVTELVDLLCLSGVYTGLPHYAAAQDPMRKTLGTMESLAAAPNATLDPASVIVALRTTFA
jgi:hypothetical protein